MLMRFCFGLLFISLSLPVLANSDAQPLDKKEIPKPLQEWIPWVMHGHEAKRCPYMFDRHENVCAWATTLDVNLQNKGGKFRQKWRVYAPSWIRLPGNEKNWPQNVKLDNKKVSVTKNASGYPTVFVTQGNVSIEGEFDWSAMPETLTLPPSTGIVSLKLSGKSVPFPVIDEQHRLWLSKSAGASEADQSDRLEIQVYRKITDDIPMKVTTHLVLKATGKQREIQLGPMPVSYFIPMSLKSELPAQIETNGTLRIQVRPGVWTVDIVTRSDAQMEVLALGNIPAPWPEQELWVFEAKNNYRLVEIKNQSIDSRQTNIPDRWKKFPAYLMTRGDKFSIATIRRGNPEPEPDQLNLSRELWLDFDGKGYTFKDKINGSITSGWRLETRPLLNLGRVNVNGQPQSITRLEEASPKSGVEVRLGNLQLNAEGRIASDQRLIPVAGWDKEFGGINTKLNLPPGWTAFYISGMDNQPNTFIQRWSLLDLFLVLVISVAIARLWSWPWGMVSLLTMAIIWHEPNAPHYTWLNLLIAIALVRVLPDMRFSKWVRAYRHFSLLLLVVFLIPFSVQQARVGLHPQLASYYSDSGYGYGDYNVAPQMNVEVASAEPEYYQAEEAPKLSQALPPPAPEKKKSLRRKFSGIVSNQSISQTQNYNLIDPNAIIQTGFGVPEWDWQSISLSWKGPVVKEQDFRMVLVPPSVNRILSFLRIALIAALVLLFLGYGFKQLSKYIRISGNTAVIMLATILIIAFQSYSPSLIAAQDYPDESTLHELRKKLLIEPNCLPRCAHAARMHMSVNPDTMQLKIQIHAAADVAIPLPADIKSWNPTKVTIDGNTADALRRDSKGQLWVRLSKGVHSLELNGSIPKISNFTLELPMIPNNVTYKLSGWRLDGVHQNGKVDSQLQFSRTEANEQHSKIDFGQSRLAPFVYVERTIQLGIDWTIQTRVVRASPGGNAIVLKVPLLRGETVTSDINVQDKQVIVNMSPNQSQFIWQSTLRKDPALTLRTLENSDWFEVWRVDISPIWHVTLKGIAPVSHTNSSRQWLPEWHPWPNERISLEVIRPIGVKGKTITVDNTRLNVTAGKRASTYEMEVNLRSSVGAKHQFIMPKGTELQSVRINQRVMPIRLDKEVLTLPVSPGKQKIAIEWRQRDELGLFYQTPKINIGVESSNSKTTVSFNRDQWVLFVGGPRLGPAVLFWGVLIVLALIAFGLGRIKTVPLKSWQWFLLAIGLTQVTIWAGLIFIACFFVLAYRQRVTDKIRPWMFNTMQICIAVLVLFAGAILIISIKQGLLGNPDMQIAGNGSSSYLLNWYSDRIGATLPQPWVISVPLIWYRVLMLGWALWLAMAVISWSKWAWLCYASDGLWKTSAKPAIPPQAPVPSLPEGSPSDK